MEETNHNGGYDLLLRSICIKLYFKVSNRIEHGLQSNATY